MSGPYELQLVHRPWVGYCSQVQAASDPLELADSSPSTTVVAAVATAPSRGALSRITFASDPIFSPTTVAASLALVTAVAPSSWALAVMLTTSLGRALRLPCVEREHQLALHKKIVFISWFNAGVRAIDIRDPYTPREVGYFIPTTNSNTFANGGKFVIQTNNVEVDDRGYIYIVDRAGSGMHILRLTGDAAQIIAP